MKTTLLPVLLMALAVTGCSPWKRIGDLTMISSRNVDSRTNYKELSRYSSADKKGLYEGNTLEAAVDAAVSQVPGGEFMRNVQVYAKGRRIRVVGDVWGLRPAGSVAAEAAQQALADQFRKGDKVVWKEGLFSARMRQGKIAGKDKTGAVVRYTDENGDKKLDRIAYKKLSKIK